MDASPARDRLGPGALPDDENRPSTGVQPCWSFTEGVIGPISRPLPDCKVHRRMRKWFAAPAKLVRRQDRQRKQTASYGTALAGISQTSPLDQTQDLLDALPSMTTHSDTIVTQDMPLSVSEAAIFVHRELECSRQSIWAQMLSAYNVDCVVNSQASAGQSVCINGLTLQVHLALPDTFCLATFFVCSYLLNARKDPVKYTSRLSLLQVQQQNLTSVHGVDAIALSANPQLTVTGGAATAVAAAVGPAFQSTCLQTLAGVGGRLELGQAAISTFPSACGSQLSCQHVIHAALPHRSGKH